MPTTLVMIFVPFPQYFLMFGRQEPTKLGAEDVPKSRSHANLGIYLAKTANVASIASTHRKKSLGDIRRDFMVHLHIVTLQYLARLLHGGK